MLFKRTFLNEYIDLPYIMAKIAKPLLSISSILLMVESKNSPISINVLPNAIPNNNPKIRETIEGARGQVPTIMIVPKKKRLQKLLKVSSLTTQENELEVENTWQSKTVAKTEEKDCTTTALCEIQAN